MEYNKKFLERLREEIISDEGCVLEVYKDHLGYFTVGVGHLIRPSDEEWGTSTGTKITQTRADELLVKDFNNVLNECEQAFSASMPNWMPNPDNKWEDWSDEVRLIVANMAFNLGLPKLKKFKKMLTAINMKNYVKASEEGLDSRWAKQVYNRSHRLMDRMRSIDEVENIAALSNN